jgi:hypothetical protein
MLYEGKKDNTSPIENPLGEGIPVDDKKKSKDNKDESKFFNFVFYIYSKLGIEKRNCC